MDIEPRAALDRLIEALLAHFEAVSANQDSEAPAVIAATDTLEDAFVTYDDALITNFDVDLPFDVYYDEDLEDEEDEDLEEDEEVADEEDDEDLEDLEDLEDEQ